MVIGERPAHDLLEVLHPPRRSPTLPLVESRLTATHRLAPEQIDRASPSRVEKLGREVQGLGHRTHAFILCQEDAFRS